MVFKSKKKPQSVKEKILDYIEKNKEKLGNDYQDMKDKISGFKEDVMSKEEISQIEEWIKKHPFMAVALALILGAAMHKLFSKGD